MLCCAVLGNELDPTLCQRQSSHTVYRLCMADHKQQNLSRCSGLSQSLAIPRMGYLAEWSLNFIAVPSGSRAIPWLFITFKQES